MFDLDKVRELIPATTIFQKSIKQVPASPVRSTGLRVLKSAASNAKLGNGQTTFTKGPWIGMPLYYLTLVERATCARSCSHFADCYGNRMPFATRYADGPELRAAIQSDVATLASKHKQGFVIRLHALGDFPDVDYVELWRHLLKEHSGLRIFGYTHWPHGSRIGDAVARLVMDHTGRVSVLRSDGGSVGDPLLPAMSIAADATKPHPKSKVICPEQLGKTDSCLTCGLCMGGKVSVSFRGHGIVPKQFVVLDRKNAA